MSTCLQYRRTRSELEEAQMKKYDWEQEQIKHMKDYIARFGHGSAKLAKQAQSKEKTLAKMERGGLTEKVRCVCCSIITPCNARRSVFTQLLVQTGVAKRYRLSPPGQRRACICYYISTIPSHVIPCNC